MLNALAADVARRLEENAKAVEDAYQIPAPEARALHQILIAANCRSMLEIGVSYGYSTVHLADAARVNAGAAGHVHAIDASEKKVTAATENVRAAGLADFVTIHLGRAQDVLPRLVPDQPFDFLFIDAVKAESFEYLDAAWPLLATSCLIATDNTLTHPEELKEFLKHLRSHPQIVSSASIDVGNGFELSVRRGS